MMLCSIVDSPHSAWKTAELCFWAMPSSENQLRAMVVPRGWSPFVVSGPMPGTGEPRV